MSDSNKNPHSLIPTSEEIDENALSFTDRLGLALCRLNCGEWDDFLGPRPDGIANWDVMGAMVYGGSFPKQITEFKIASLPTTQCFERRKYGK